MMYDSIEFTYRDFTETLDLEDRFDTDNLLFSHEITESIAENTEKDATPATGEISSPVKNNLLLSCNNSGQYFSIATESIDERNIIQSDNTDSNFVQAQNSFCDESTLLDENIVDQFLIPSPISSKLNEVIFFFNYSYYLCLKFYFKISFFFRMARTMVQIY